MTALASKIQHIPQYVKNGIHNVKNKFNEFDKKLEKVAQEAFQKIKNTFSNVISNTYKSIKNHKLLSFSVITALVSSYLNIIYIAPIALSTSAIYETISYFTSADYKFKCLAKKYIKSIGDIHKLHREGQVITNDYEKGIANQTFSELQEKVIERLKSVKNKEQLEKWTNDLKNINPYLEIMKKTLPRYDDIHEKIFDDTFPFKSIISQGLYFYVDSLIKNTIKDAENDYKKLITENAAKLVKQHSTSTTDSIIADFVKNSDYPNILFKSLDQVAKDLKVEIEQLKAKNKE